jgi:hypothetical protein
MRRGIFILILSVLLLIGGEVMAFELKSPAFEQGGNIPKRYTCEGQDISVPLIWKDAPLKTRSFALISDDPDAPIGIWVHWVIYDIPDTATELKEGIPTDASLPDGSRQGMNDFRRIGYGGPCPPPGKPHRYFFKLYALDTMLYLNPGATKKQLLKAMEGHILAETQLIGKYQR